MLTIDILSLIEKTINLYDMTCVLVQTFLVCLIVVSTYTFGHVGNIQRTAAASEPNGELIYSLTEFEYHLVLKVIMHQKDPNLACPMNQRQ